jgi:hypothetical protein
MYNNKSKSKHKISLIMKFQMNIIKALIHGKKNSKKSISSMEINF